MIENPFVKKLVKGVLRNRKQSLLDRSIMHPMREWLTGLMLGGLILTLGVVWGVSTYMQFSNVSVGGEAVENVAVVYRQSLVETAILDFDERKKEYEALKQELLNKQRRVDTVILPPVVEVATTTEETTSESEPDVSTPMPEGSVPSGNPTSE